jgi:hypothetical protein
VSEPGEGWTRLVPSCAWCDRDLPDVGFVRAACGCRCCSENHAKKHAKLCGRDPEIGKYNEIDHRNG